MTTKLSGRLVNDNTVSPLDFGAVGNGTTDDTAAVQRAIDHIETATGAKVLELQNKSYLITYPLSLNTGDVRIQNGKFIYTPATAHRGKVMLKITVAQADETYFDIASDSSKHMANTRVIETEGTTFSGAVGSYLFLEDRGWDYVYKGISAPPEDQFPRSDRAFKGELVRIEDGEPIGTNNRNLWLENHLSFLYSGDLTPVRFRSLTMLDDILFENVDFQGPGIVRKQLTTSAITIVSGVRKFDWGSTDHGLTQNEYFTVDTGDLPAGGQYLDQGVFKVTSDPSSASVIESAALSARTAEDGSTSDTPVYNTVDAAGDTSAAAQPNMYIRSEIAMSAEHVANLKMINCSVTGFGEAGVVTMKCWEPEFSNCHFEGSRPEGSGGLVIGNGCYKPFIHDCKFTGYNGLSLGTTRLKVLADHVDLKTNSGSDSGKHGFSYLGAVTEGVVKNNTFRVKESGITIRENAVNTDVVDNNFDLLATFEGERYSISQSNRLLTRGVNSSGLGVSVLRNQMKGIMESGIYHRQCHKAAYHNVALSGGSKDIGDTETRNNLFTLQAKVDPDTSGDGTVYGNRDIGNEVHRFYVNIIDNKIDVASITTSIYAGNFSALSLISRYGVYIENETAGRGGSPTAFATKVNVSNNHISGQLANIRMNVKHGRFKGVHIINNLLDATPYLNLATGGSGNAYGYNPGIDGFYNDKHLQTDGTAYTQPSHMDGIAKASGVCLMIDNHDTYSSVDAEARYEDVDISRNVFYRSQKLQDSVPDSNWADADGGSFAAGGPSHISLFFDTKVASQVRHISINQNKFHYGGAMIVAWETYRSPTGGDNNDVNGNSTIGSTNTIVYSSLEGNVGNNRQTEAVSGEADTYTAPTGQVPLAELKNIQRFNTGGTGILLRETFHFGRVEGSTSGDEEAQPGGNSIMTGFPGASGDIIKTNITSWA